MLLISWYAAYSAAEVAAEVAANGVLPEGCWTFGAVMLGVLAPVFPIIESDLVNRTIHNP